MGPNGSGKSTLSHVLMGRGDYEVTGGSVTIDGEELLGLPTHERAARGPLPRAAVPGRAARACASATSSTPRSAARAATPDDLARAGRRRGRRGSASRQQFLERGVNVEFSGGEQKRAETLQLAVLRAEVRGARRDRLRPRRRRAARRRPPRRGDDHRATTSACSRSRTTRALLDELRPDGVHVLMGGRVVASGGPELADELEETGYEGLAAELGVEAPSVDDRAARPTPSPTRLLSSTARRGLQRSSARRATSRLVAGSRGRRASAAMTTGVPSGSGDALDRRRSSRARSRATRPGRCCRGRWCRGSRSGRRRRRTR